MATVTGQITHEQIAAKINEHLHPCTHLKGMTVDDLTQDMMIVPIPDTYINMVFCPVCKALIENQVMRSVLSTPGRLVNK